MRLCKHNCCIHTGSASTYDSCSHYLSNLLNKINVVAVIQNDEFNIAMDPDTPLKADEPLLIIMKKSDLKRFER